MAVGGVLGSAIGAAASLGGSAASAGASKALQEDQQQFIKNMYRQRYQLQMEDMRKAGLNPILAYRTGAGGMPSGGLANAGDIGASVAKGIGAGAQAARVNAETKLMEANASSAESMAELNRTRAAVERRRLPKAEMEERLMSYPLDALEFLEDKLQGTGFGKWLRQQRLKRLQNNDWNYDNRGDR